MKIGYARISTEEQSLDLQHDGLRKAGCAEFFEDRGAWGVATQRPGLEAALKDISENDVLVVWKLNRLGRSLAHLIIETVKSRGARRAGFASLSEGIDTTTAGGKLVFRIMGALAEFERTLIVERVNAGIAAARKRRKHVGRPRKLTTEQIAHVRKAIEADLQTRGLAELLGVDGSTLWRAIRATNDASPATAMPRAMDGGGHGHH